MNKHQLIESLREMEVELANLISKLEAQSFDVTGTLNCTGKGDKKRFYLYEGRNKTYLGKGKHDVVTSLAEKQYHDKVLRAARMEKGQIERCIKTLDSGRGISDIDEVLQAMSSSIRALVKPYEETDDGYAEKWYRENGWHANKKRAVNSALVTERGEVVKSKSEIIIADRLYHAGVPYIYEIPVSFTKGMSLRYPDFYVLNKRTRKEYFWEHQGKMDDSDYCKESQLKLEEYAANGYLLGKNLIFTYESSGRVLSTKYVDALIKEFLI